MKSKDVTYWLGEGDRFYSSREYEKAIKCYEKATLLEPENIYAFCNWGFALSNLNEINNNEASQNHKIFQEKSENIKDPELSLIKGMLYFLILKDEQKAEEYLKKSKKNILEMLTSLDIESRKEIIKTKILHSILDYDNFFIETTKGIEKKELDEYKKTYISSIFIVSLLYIGNENESEHEHLVAHYCKKDISQKLLFGNSKFKLNAINYSNDPSEGKALLEFLYGKERYPTDEKLKNNDYEAFAGCFTFNYDSLNQFRLYGKEDSKEGTGLSLVFWNNFFNKEAKMGLEPPKIDSDKMNNNSPKEEKFSLFRCIYIDPEIKQSVITLGQKEESLFYREGKGNDFKKYNKNINKIINRIKVEMNKLKDQAKNLDPVIVGQLLINLRYLIKHIAFKEEQECRIVKIHHLHNNKIVIRDDYKQIYIEYPPKVPIHIKKIYFGPKATDFELFKSMLKNKRLEIECKKSTNPLA